MTQESMIKALQKVARWRMLFTGWHLGTRSASDPEAQSFKNLYELLIIMRVENTALAGALIEKGLITHELFQKHIEIEAKELDKGYEGRFPGYKTDEKGLIIYDVQKAKETTKGWKP